MRLLVSHLLIAARLTIVRHWKDVNPPPIVETLQLIKKHNAYETQFAQSVGIHKKVSEIWNIWLTWLVYFSYFFFLLFFFFIYNFLINMLSTQDQLQVVKAL